MWIEINKEDIVNVDEGAKMRIGGCECVFSKYDEDYEFFVEDETLPDNSNYMADYDWEKWIVEVWEESEAVTTTPPPFKDMKFRVRDEEHSKQIQETLFGLGYSWGVNHNQPRMTGCPFLFTYEGGSITFDEDSTWFDSHENPEHTIKPVGGFEIVPVEPDIPAKKMTKEEIEEILGYKVDIVSGE